MNQAALFDESKPKQHKNSLIVYAFLRNSRKIHQRHRMICELLEERRLPMTIRQIKEALRFPDMNNVRPRVTELLGLGVLEECGSVYDAATESRVMQVRLRMQLQKASEYTD